MQISQLKQEIPNMSNYKGGPKIIRRDILMTIVVQKKIISYVKSGKLEKLATISSFNTFI